MRPRLARNDSVNKRIGYAVIFGNRFCSVRIFGANNISTLISAFNINHILFGKLGKFVFRSVSWVCFKTPLIMHILHVVFMGSQEKVGGVATWRVVALMANRKTFRALSVRKLPSGSVGIDKNVFYTDSSISRLCATLWPFPTFIGVCGVKSAPKFASVYGESGFHGKKGSYCMTRYQGCFFWVVAP